MKKILTLLLAAVMAVGLSATAFATIEFMDPDVDIEDLCLPGQMYVFGLRHDGADLNKYYYDDFKTSVKVSEGKSYVDTCSIKRRDDGTYALYFKAKKNSSYTQPNGEPKTVKIVITEIEKIDRKFDVANKESTELVLQVGYPSSDYVSYDEYTVSNGSPIVEFSDSLSRCTISFGYSSEYDAKFSKKTQFNLSYSEDENRTVSNKNQNATMTFISFPTKPRFDISSEFRIESSNGKYVYEITDKGLKNLNATKKGDHLAFKTDQLTAYVASDIVLNNVTSSSSSSSNSNNSSSSKNDATPPTGGGAALSQNTVLTTVNTALASTAQGKIAYPTFQNAESISADAIKAANTAAVNAGKKVLLTFDTVQNKKVVGRYYIDASKAAKVTNDIKLGITADNANVRAVFSKYYTNKFAIANFAQKSPFGMTVSVAVKLDLSQLNTNTLKFYAYDAKLNKYDQIVPAYSVDSIGYLYFDTALGGDIIITDKVLTLK